MIMMTRCGLCALALLALISLGGVTAQADCQSDDFLITDTVLMAQDDINLTLDLPSGFIYLGCLSLNKGGTMTLSGGTQVKATNSCFVYALPHKNKNIKPLDQFVTVQVIELDSGLDAWPPVCLESPMSLYVDNKGEVPPEAFMKMIHVVEPQKNMEVVQFIEALGYAVPSMVTEVMFAKRTGKRNDQLVVVTFSEDVDNNKYRQEDFNYLPVQGAKEKALLAGKILGSFTGSIVLR